jgi:hypothetical protein
MVSKWLAVILYSLFMVSFGMAFYTGHGTIVLFETLGLPALLIALIITAYRARKAR